MKLKPIRIIGVNGIATHGEGNINVMLSLLQSRGFRTRDIALPKRHFISAWWGHKSDALTIVNNSEDGDAVIAHSFGGPRVAQAMKLGRKFSAVFMFRPAHSKRHVFPDGSKVYCFHSQDDVPVKIGAWLPFHPFGRAGVDGYAAQPGLINIRSSGDHNADFSTHLHQRVDYVDDQLSKL